MLLGSKTAVLRELREGEGCNCNCKQEEGREGRAGAGRALGHWAGGLHSTMYRPRSLQGMVLQLLHVQSLFAAARCYVVTARCSHLDGAGGGCVCVCPRPSNLHTAHRQRLRAVAPRRRAAVGTLDALEMRLKQDRALVVAAVRCNGSERRTGT